MAIPDIVFIRGVGGLGQPLPGQDFISGLLIYTNTLPSGFSSTARVKKVGSVLEAEALGIKADYSDGTKATGTVALTRGATGDTVTITVTEPLLNADGTFTTKVVTLCAYTQVAGDSSNTLLGTSVAAAINAGTSTHGYSAVNATGTLTITARAGLGIALNSGTPLAAAITGTLAAVVTQFSGGAYSLQAIWHYWIARFFAMSQKGVLWIGMYAVPGTYTFSEVQTMQNYTSGAIRQMAVFKDPTSAYSTSDLDTLQTISTTLETLHMPLDIVYGADLSATTDITTLTDLSTKSDYFVSDCIGQDGSGLGAWLYKITGKSITQIGDMLGALSAAKVNECIGWVQKFNINDGVENIVPAFANGQLVSAISASLQNQLDTFRHNFATTRIGFSGSFFNNDHNAVSYTSDYSYKNLSRPFNKLERVIYTALVPFENSPILLNADGTMRNESIAALNAAIEPSVQAMVNSGEISAYAVTIDPTQNILQTGKLKVAVKPVPTATARQIEVSIKYATAL